MAATMTEMMSQVGTETVHMKLQSKTLLNPQPPNMPKPKIKLRLDPQRALEPARKKLSTVEAQRVMSVLLETIKRTELVSVIPYVLKSLDRFNIVLGTDLVHMLQEHSVIISSFNELKETTKELLSKEQAKGLSEEVDEGINVEETGENVGEADTENNGSMRSRPGSKSSQRSASRTSNGNQADEAMRNMALVAKQMQFSCKNILRAFSNNPAAVTSILKEQAEEKSAESSHLISEMKELKDILMGMLLTTPVEEIERHEYLQEISQRERYNAGIIHKLETELNAAVDDKEFEIRKKNDVIRRLQADLHQIEKFSDEHIRRTKSEAEKQEASDLKNSEGKRSKLHQEITQLRTQMQNLVSEHRENEQWLRKKKYKIETEVENWIQKYDQDMGERQSEFEEIDTVYTEEKKQLTELEERFKTLDEEYNGIMEERRIARERQEAAERELSMCVGAATTIQAFWRSYKVRKALKSKKKKKGGKGKKGKK